MAHYWKNREGVSGRGGIGAVLGSKNLKAVVVKGARKTEVADAPALKALVDETREPLKTGTKALTTFGTPFLVGPINALGGLGAYNLRQETFAEARAVSGEEMKLHYHDRDTTCLKCPVACGKQYAIAEGEFGGTTAKMPEYETIFALGPMLGISNPEALILANDLCDLLGMDTISIGVTLAFAMRSQHFTALGDSLVMCRFTSERGFGLFIGEPYATMVRAVTGWDVTVDELERVGERIINLERLFNVREGVRRAQDVLPWRVMHEPIPEGPSAGMHCSPAELSTMLDDYYALRGWDADGVPTRARLAALGLRR